MSEAVDDFKPKRKRQRLTYTCNYCRRRKIKCDKAKPKCSNCAKFGRVCEYESAYWVNTSVDGNDTVKTKVTSENDNQNKSREELYEEIELWKSRATGGTSVTDSTFPSPDPQNQLAKGKNSRKENFLIELGDHGGDIIDLYSSYDTLTEKHSSEEDNKPLNPMSIYKADHYMVFFLCFKFITLQITSNSLSKKIEQGWKSRHPDGATKWLSLLNLKKGDIHLQNSIKRVTNDRVKLHKTNILPFTNLQDSDDVNAQYLISRIEELIPGRLVGNVLLGFFFRHIWPLSPFIDEESFRNDIKRLITYDDMGEKIKVTISQRSDFATLSTFLVILRYTSVAVQVVDDKDLSIFLLPLKQHIIPVEAIPVAQLCLSMYKLLKKTTLHMIQALLYLRVYFKDCPEDGDGLTLGQSQMLLGIIVQSALSMGLHRDPENYTAASDVKVANVRRRIWFGIVSLDTETSVLSGAISVVPPSFLTCVKYPVLTLGDPLERAQLSELEKESGLQCIHKDLCDAINRMDEKPSLSKLVGLMNDAREYVNGNYPMSFMSPISDHDDTSQLYKAAMLKNHKIIEKNLFQICLEITIYQFLYIQYEDNNRLDAEMFKYFYGRCLETLTIGFDISGAYLSGALKNYVNAAESNFALFPIITTLTYRMINAVTATLLRCFHSQDLLRCRLFSTVDVDSEAKAQYFEKLIKPLCDICGNHLNIYEQAVGAKYHLSLKTICSCKFSYSALKKHRFSVLNKIVDFLETNDDAKFSDIFWEDAKKDEIRTVFQLNTGMFEVYSQWMQLAKSYKASLQASHEQGQQFAEHQQLCDVIINISHANHFIGFTETEIDEFVEILSGGFKYCSVSASTNNVEEQFANGASSTTDSYDSFYDLLSGDPMFSAQISNVLRKTQSTTFTPAQANSDSYKNFDFINEIFGPTVDTVGQFDEFFKQ